MIDSGAQPSLVCCLVSSPASAAQCAASPIVQDVHAEFKEWAVPVPDLACSHAEGPCGLWKTLAVCYSVTYVVGKIKQVFPVVVSALAPDRLWKGFWWSWHLGKSLSSMLRNISKKGLGKVSWRSAPHSSASAMGSEPQEIPQRCGPICPGGWYPSQCAVGKLSHLCEHRRGFQGFPPSSTGRSQAAGTRQH